MICSPRCSSDPVTRSPAPLTAATTRSAASSRSCVRFWCEPVMAPRTRSAFVDDRLALRHEFVDQRADADLVVGIGALQRRDLAAHQGLELAGAGERPLDAVADGGDFAAHGLRDRQHGVGREAFGLRETHGDLADGAGHQLHLLRAHGQHRGDEEEQDRRDQHEAADRELGGREGGEQLLRES